MNKLPGSKAPTAPSDASLDLAASAAELPARTSVRIKTAVKSGKGGSAACCGAGTCAPC